MEVGWGGASGPSSSYRAKVSKISPCTSALYFLGERKAERSCCALLEQRRSASAAHCSTSGPSHHHAQQVASRSNLYHGRRRRGQCSHATEGFPSLVGSVGKRGSTQEVMEWRPRSTSSGQRQDGREDSGEEVEREEPEEEVQGLNYSIASEGMQLELAGYDESPGLGSEGSTLDEPTGRKDGSEEEEVEGQKEPGTRRGWRGLAAPEDVTQRGRSNAYLSKKPWRKSSVVRQRLNNVDYMTSSSPREGKKLLTTSRDTNLEDLFKSLSSPQRSDRSSAVEKYFGRELNEKAVASKSVEMAGDRGSAGDSPVSGNTIRESETDFRAREPSSPSLPTGGGRLKINLDLDLYRAKCLREEGKFREADAILKQCIRDWQDDGRAYLALGLLALPLRTESNTGVALNERTGAGKENKTTFDGDYLPFGEIVEGEGSDSFTATIPRSPAVSEGGERLKINLDLQLHQAKCLRQRGRPDVSEATLRKCIRDWPDDGRPYVALGKQLSEQNRIQEARALYDSGCQAMRGENPYIWQAWAILEEKCGDVSKARKLFDAATVADKKHVAGWHGWAKLELRAGNLRRARSLLNKGLKFCGPNEYIFQTLALMDFRDGKVEQARSLLSKATQFNPKSAASWLAWALMEAENNLTEAARRLFQKGIEASPRNRYVWQAWALFEAKQGKEERARELFQRGRELNPKDAVLLQAFALFEFDCGRPGIARDLFRRALTCNSSHQPAWIAWGWMEWKERNLSVARELYQKAIQADSRSMDAARAFQAWGVLEDREGDSGLARELFKCALKIDSQNVPTWMSWAAMEDREGRSVRAEEIRNLFLQQRTEVVEGAWNVDFSDLLSPAIDRIKGFFKGDRRPGQSGFGTKGIAETDLLKGRGGQGLTDPNVDGQGLPLDTSSDDREFDVESFLKEKFPWKYGSLEIGKSARSNLVQKPTRR